MKDSSGNYIKYGPFAFDAQGQPTPETATGLETFLMGSSSFSATLGANPLLTKVDYSAWDLSQACGSCHVGGGFVEKTREGVRFSQIDMATEGVSPYTMTIFERYSPTTGLPAHTVEPAPWRFPIWNGATPLTAAGGWGQEMSMVLPDGSAMPVVAGQVMMPNVKEMDCLMCHFEGFNNLLSSVMAYNGAHYATASFGAGFMNMFTEAYDFTTGLLSKDAQGRVSLSERGLSKLKYDPPSQNCRNCHMPSNLKDIPDMMRDFLSSAPMVYTGNFTKSFTGLAMPSFDFNATFGATWDWRVMPYASSPTLYMTMTGVGSLTEGFDTTIPSGWPASMGRTIYNQTAFNNFSTAMPGMKQYFVGGGNPPMTGPLYYEAPLEGGGHDQNVLKKSTVPFPRAEWFKRGDMWVEGYDVHLNFDCAGCHMDTATTKVDTLTFDGKSACDPGRGYDSAGGVEANPAYRATVNSQNTVKTCEACHVTGKNRDGADIATFGAPNPTTSHTNAGLLAKVTKAVRINATTKAEENFTGDHLDVLDCTVCHLKRSQMVVRLLDCTSGNRYPNMLGFNENMGMMGMFSDPMGAGTAIGSNLTSWIPLYTWQKGGNDFKTKNNGDANPDWRRKIYAVNLITAAIWNNISSTVDANGDGVPGRAPSIHAGTPEVTPSTNYDPWISRDMKAGMNFGPSGFAPIPVGFGGGDFQAAYNAQGGFTGAMKYVGVYGGNAMFSTPEEITAYKAWRNSIKDSVDGKNWGGTQLGFVAGPYKLTHGIRPVNQFVVGKKTEAGFGCADCHASRATAIAPMFDGTINMVGTAINTQKAITNGQNLFTAPAEVMEVVGLAEDIETAAEVSTKAGGAVEITFDEHGDWNGTAFTPNPLGDYKRVTELDRNLVLYPNASGVSFIDAKGNTYANREAWTAYLTGITANNIGIGVEPVATVTSTTDEDATKVGTQMYLNNVYANNLVANAAANTNGAFTYTWKFDDGTPAVTGASASKTFTKLGTWAVTLEVADEEGKIARSYRKVEVVLPPAGTTVTDHDYVVAGPYAGTPAVNGAGESIALNGYNKVSFGGANMPTHTKIYVVWGDGKAEYFSGTGDIVNKYHKFPKYAMYDRGLFYAYNMVVYVYNNDTLMETKKFTIQIEK